MADLSWCIPVTPVIPVTPRDTDASVGFLTFYLEVKCTSMS